MSENTENVQEEIRENTQEQATSDERAAQTGGEAGGVITPEKTVEAVSEAAEAVTEADVEANNGVEKETKKKRQGRYDKKRKGRTRNFATVVYPESAPSDWQERLSELHIEALISPLHDCDVNPNGSPKKPHWHVMVMFPSVKEFDTQVKPIFDAIGGVGRENVGSVRGYARYLCHLDNPEKHQYSPSDVIQMSGANYAALIALPSGDGKIVTEIMQFVIDNGIRSYANLMLILAQVNTEWFNLLLERKTYVISEFIKSYSWERESGYLPREVVTDPKTGEARIIVREVITDPKTGKPRDVFVDPKTGEVMDPKTGEEIEFDD